MNEVAKGKKFDLSVQLWWHEELEAWQLVIDDGSEVITLDELEIKDGIVQLSLHKVPMYGQPESIKLKRIESSELVRWAKL